jgi:hypothetical protein
VTAAKVPWDIPAFGCKSQRTKVGWNAHIAMPSWFIAIIKTTDGRLNTTFYHGRIIF